MASPHLLSQFSLNRASRHLNIILIPQKTYLAPSCLISGILTLASDLLDLLRIVVALLSSLDSLNTLFGIQLVNGILLANLSCRMAFLNVITWLVIYNIASWAHHFTNWDVVPSSSRSWSLCSSISSIDSWVALVTRLSSIILLELLIIRLKAAQAVADKGTESAHTCCSFLGCVFLCKLLHANLLRATVNFRYLLLSYI